MNKKISNFQTTRICDHRALKINEIHLFIIISYYAVLMLSFETQCHFGKNKRQFFIRQLSSCTPTSIWNEIPIISVILSSVHLQKKKNFFLHKGRELELQCRFPSLGLLLLIGHNQILSSVLVQIVHQTNRANTMSSSKGKGNRYYNWVYQIEDRNSCLINHKEFSLFKLSWSSLFFAGSHSEPGLVSLITSI